MKTQARKPLTTAVPPEPVVVLTKDSFTDEIRTNLLCSALEGGSNYWYWLGNDATKVINKLAPRNKDFTDTLVDRIYTALKAGGEIPVRDAEDPKTVLGKLSMAGMVKAEILMHNKHQRHYADVICENDDATTGDVFFQLAVMEEIVYG